MPKHGFFIALEGTDGSGKTSQFKLLLKSLRVAGKRVVPTDFPQYGQLSARLVEQYLNGKFGSAREVGPYRASLFYALDRFEAASQMRQWLKQGRIIVSNRYVLSNAAHQGGKIASRTARKLYWRWLFNLEYKILGIPQPDLTILLHVPAGIAQNLVDKKGPREYLKGVKRDIHEADLRHLKDAERTYLELAKKNGYTVVECVERGRLLAPKEIHHKVWKIINNKHIKK